MTTTSKQRPILVEKTADWRRFKRGERDAGLAPSQQCADTAITLYYCDICKICIGPGHYEQRMYFHLIRDQYVCCGDTTSYFFAAWFKLCGGCAHARGRNVPETFCALRPEHWLTNELLCAEGETPQPVDLTRSGMLHHIRRAITAHITGWYAYLLSLLLALFRIPLAWCATTQAQTTLPSPQREVMREEQVASSLRYRVDQSLARLKEELTSVAEVGSLSPLPLALLGGGGSTLLSSIGP